MSAHVSAAALYLIHDGDQIKPRNHSSLALFSPGIIFAVIAQKGQTDRRPWVTDKTIIVSLALVAGENKNAIHPQKKNTNLLVQKLKMLL